MTISKKIGISWTNSTASHKVIYLLASGFGIGFLPYIPATFGSLWGLLAYYCTYTFPWYSQIFLFLLFMILAIGLAEKAQQFSRVEDPSFVIVDEIVGMWATLLFLWKFNALVLILGFILFRLYDILKFFPINLFEGYSGGLGIVLDDLAAGMLANITLRVILLTFFS
ncbi:MAG: phosphatidylglycerophosphatase A [Candidatus Riflebacteria bacterium]|nr:phosphatidylglycerophosphatase A [Candidatus Riflebacteria bacterium]